MMITRIETSNVPMDACQPLKPNDCIKHSKQISFPTRPENDTFEKQDKKKNPQNDVNLYGQPEKIIIIKHKINDKCSEATI